MILIEKVFKHQCEHDLVLTAEDFSTDWCGKSKSWYAVQKHSGSEFSVTAAINCLDKVSMKLVLLKMSRRRMGGLLEAEIRALDEIRQRLKEYLNEQHRITEVKLTKTAQITSKIELRRK